MDTIGVLYKEVQDTYGKFVELRVKFANSLYDCLVRVLYGTDLIVGDYRLISLNGKLYKRGFVNPLTKNDLINLYEKHKSLRDFVDSYLP